MDHEIDRTFRTRKIQHSEQRRRKAVRQKLSFLAGCLVLAAGVIGIGFALDRHDVPEELGPADDADQPELTQVAEEFAVPVYVPALIDLPGDPIRIELGAGQSGRDLAQVPVPIDLAALGVSGTITVLNAKLIETGQRLSLTVPSSQQDFAFFQSQRGAADRTAGEPEPEGPAQEEAFPASVDQTPAYGESTGEDGWGNIGEAGLTGADTTFEQTEIQNNVSSIVLTPELSRLKVTEDVFVQVVNAVGVETFMAENGINILDARRVSSAFRDILSIETFEPGSLVAMRQLRTGGKQSDRKPMQIAVYLPDRFIGALAATGPDSFSEGVDPWAGTNLFRHTGERPSEAGPPPTIRLLDGIFAAATRNGVPSGIAGEAIMYLSRNQDLSGVAGPDDTVTLVYASQERAGGESPGRILLASLGDGKKQSFCFVFRPEGTTDFNCYDEHDQSNTIEVSNGMVTPVSGGVKTSGFGPRNHPILKTVLLHKGVDWAAPTGTPVLAAFDGSVASAGNGGGYGNVIRLSHAAGQETLYAHLSRFAPSIKPGVAVKAGDVIGFVGTTGRSTGPHLHFELHRGGVPVNPLAETVAAIASSGGDAVEQLVNRIIHIESGGNPNAKNPLSTASGLGQFIESTWLRMMRTYRADLASSLSREKQLALRFDPTLSREMVTNLAKENKAYLESAGHQVSAGRLYLAHFLGPEGARIVLSNGDGSDLATILGAGVIRANPFLTGKDVAYIKAWAERKMGGRAPAVRIPVTVATKTVRQASPEFNRFREATLRLKGTP